MHTLFLISNPERVCKAFRQLCVPDFSCSPPLLATAALSPSPQEEVNTLQDCKLTLSVDQLHFSMTALELTVTEVPLQTTLQCQHLGCRSCKGHPNSSLPSLVTRLPLQLPLPQASLTQGSMTVINWNTQLTFRWRIFKKIKNVSCLDISLLSYSSLWRSEFLTCIISLLPWGTSVNIPCQTDLLEMKSLFVGLRKSLFLLRLCQVTSMNTEFSTGGGLLHHLKYLPLLSSCVHSFWQEALLIPVLIPL